MLEQVFGEGYISAIDVVKRRNPDKKSTLFNQAYIHMKEWPEHLHVLRDKLIRQEPFHIVYDEPHYWLCLQNKATKKGHETVKKHPHIVYNPSSSKSTNSTVKDYLPDGLNEAEEETIRKMKDMQVTRSDHLGEWHESECSEC